MWLAGTITVPYNDAEILAEVFDRQGEDIAAVIIEPVPGNMGLILPKPGYLNRVREITAAHGSLLIFDEVMSGFRAALGGAQSVYGIKPDLTCLGKVIGGGLPVGAYGGRREIMEQISPAGPVYQAGTLSGNPLAMAAGITTLKILESNPDLYGRMAALLARLCDGIRKEAEKYGFRFQFHNIGTMFCVFFSDKEVIDYETAKRSDIDAFNRYFHYMLEQGIYLAPSQFETGFMSIAHSDADVEANYSRQQYGISKVSAKGLKPLDSRA